MQQFYKYFFCAANEPRKHILFQNALLPNMQQKSTALYVNKTATCVLTGLINMKSTLLHINNYTQQSNSTSKNPRTKMELTTRYPKAEPVPITSRCGWFFMISEGER